MPNIKVYGTVLHFVNYRENDRMLSILTPQQGLMSVLSRGCKRPKSPLLQASDMFLTGEFMLYEKSGRFTLVSASIDRSYYDIRLDAQKLACATLMLQVCAALVQENEECRDIFAVLQEALECLQQSGAELAVGICNYFLFRLLHYAGFKPRIVHCIACEERIGKDNSAHLGFDFHGGGVVCANCLTEGLKEISRPVYLELYKLAVFKPYSDLSQIKTHKSVLNVLLDYIELTLGQRFKASRLIH